MKKRILPALLALCMVMSLLPVSVFAAEGDDLTGNDTNVSAQQQCACYETTEGENKTHSTTSGGGATQCTQKKSVTIETLTYTYKEGADTDATNANKENAKNAAIAAEVAKLAPWYCETCAAALDGGDEEDPVTVCPDCGCAITEAEGSCTAELCAHNATSFKGDRPAGCAYSVCGEKNCTSFDTNVKNHTVHVYQCVDGGANSSLASCNKSEGHTTDCALACKKGGCTKTAGHTGDHANSKCLADADDAHCVAETHVYPCPNATPIDTSTTEATTANEKASEDNLSVTVYIPCTCGSAKHNATTFAHEEGVADTCPNDASNDTTKKGVAVSVKVSFEYQWPTKKEDPDNAGQYIAMTAAEIKTAKDNAYDTALGTAKTAAKAKAIVENPTAVCSKCAAELGSVCTKAIDCPATAGHRADCLKLCTHGPDCPNSIDNPSAHTVWYQVKQTNHAGTTTDVANAMYKTREEAVAKVAALRAANDVAVDEAETADAKAEAKIIYSIVTDHCPKAGVSSSVVLGGDDAAVTDPTEPTDPEVKAPEKAEDFEDVTADAWYAEELTALMEKGIVKGSLDGGKYTFKASDPMNTSYLVVMLSRVLEKDHNTEGANWDKEATEWATEEGYLEGIEAGQIVRKDVVLVLWRAAGKPESEQSLEAFPDAEGLEGDALAAMKWAVEKEIIKGDGDTGTLKTDDVITRAEMVAVLSRYSNVK